MDDFEVKYCTNCGNKLKKADVFCFACGQKQGIDNTVSNLADRNKKSTKKRNVILIIVTLLIVASIGLFICFRISKNSLRGEWKCRQLETVDDYLAEVLSDVVKMGLKSNAYTSSFYSVAEVFGADELINAASSELIAMFEIDDALRKYTFYVDKSQIQLMYRGKTVDMVPLSDSSYFTIEMPYTVDEDEISIDMNIHLSVNENIDLGVTDLDIVFEEDFDRSFDGEFTLEDDDLNIVFDDYELDFVRKEK